MVTVERLLRLPVFQGASVLSGKKGLGHSVQYVDVAEVPDINFWINPNVFILTTAYAFHKDSHSLMTLMEGLVKNQAAGLGIKLGRFLDELPQEVCDYAENSDLPIILLPPDLRYTHAIRAITETILEDEHRHSSSENLDDAFKRIVFEGEESTSEAFKVFEATGISLATPAAVIVAVAPPSDIEKSMMSVKEVAQRHGNLSATVRTPWGAAMLVRTFSSLKCDFSGYSCFVPEGVYAVVGEERPLKEIRRSYDGAAWGARLLRLFSFAKGVYSAEETGLFFPLFSHGHREKSMESAHTLLKPLIDYDSHNNASLLETLWMFALCDRNHKETAKRLHLHRNTLRYRIFRIEHLLPNGSLNGVAFHRLFLALMLHFVDCA